MAQPEAEINLRKAVISDVPQIHKLISVFAERNEMLHRSLSELYDTLRDFFVIEKDSAILACAALHVTWENLAELKCVAVAPQWHGKGLGCKIVRKCLDDARTLGITRVFALTYKPDFFKKFGFRIVERNSLPHKVWGECIKCHKFPDCNETAMVCELDQQPSNP